MPDTLTASRPGRDPSAPFSDLYLAADEPSESPAMSAPLDSASASGRPGSSRLTGHVGGGLNELPPIHIQIASLHRAAEVARYEWRARERQRAAARSSREDARTAATARRSHAPATAPSLDVGYHRIPVWIEERHDSSTSRHRRAPSSSRSSQEEGQDVGRSTGVGILDISSGSSDSSSSSSTSSDSEATENALLPAHRNRSTTSFETSSQIWDRLLHDLAIGAGIERSNASDGVSDGVTSGGTGSMATLLSLSSTQFRSRNAPSSSAPRLPHPIWARRYSGPAGDWLRAELARRYTSFLGSQAANRPQPSSASRADLDLYRTQRSSRGEAGGVSHASPASRRLPPLPTDPSSADAPASSPGRGTDRLVFPALDPEDRSGQPVPALPRGSAEEEEEEDSPEPPARAVRATPSTAMTLYPRPGFEARASRSSRVGGDPARGGGANVNRSGAAGSAAAPPPHESAQSQAASDVARMAARARENARRAAEDVRRSGGAASRQQGGAQANTSNERSRATQGGMDYLRRLRRLDGLEDENGQRVAPPIPARAPSPPPSRHDVFPWYQARPPQSLSREPTALQSRDDGFDPDGEAADWYTNARARMEEYQRRARHEQGLLSDEDDQDEAGMLDPDGEGEPRLPPPPPQPPMPRSQIRSYISGATAQPRPPRQTASASQRHRNRSALVMAVEAPDDGQGGAQGGVQGWTLVDAHLADSPTETPPRSASPDLLAAPAAPATTWLNPNRRFSTSPSPIDGGGTDGPEQPDSSTALSSVLSGRRQELTGSRTGLSDLRSLRRPQRLPSVSNADVESLHSSRGASRSPSESPVDVAVSPPPPPQPQTQPIPVFASSARRASFLTGRPSRGPGESPVQPPPQPVVRSSRSSQERRLAASLSSASELASQLTAEIRSRHSELIARERHLRAQLARRREELDQLRRRDGRIGRVLDAPSGETGAQVTTSEAQTSQPTQAPSPPRRSLRDVAPRRAMVGSVVEAASPSLSLARQASVAAAEDGEEEEKQTSLRAADEETNSDVAGQTETASPSEMPSTGPPSPSSSSSSSQHDAPSLAVPKDVEELGSAAISLLSHVDTLGMPRYDEAALGVVRDMADSRLHPPLPAARNDGEEGGAALELERVLCGSGPRSDTTSRDVLQVRIVGCNPPSSTSGPQAAPATSSTMTPSLPTRHEQAWALASLEDADWSTARARVLARASANANSGESHIDMRRRALGLPSRGAGGRGNAAQTGGNGAEGPGSASPSWEDMMGIRNLSGPHRSEVLLRYLTRFGSTRASLDGAAPITSIEDWEDPSSSRRETDGERTSDAIGESPSRDTIEARQMQGAVEPSRHPATAAATRVAEASRIQPLRLTPDQRGMLLELLSRQGGRGSQACLIKGSGGGEEGEDEGEDEGKSTSSILDALIDSRASSFASETKARLRSMGALRSQAPLAWLQGVSLRLRVSAPVDRLCVALFASVEGVSEAEMRSFMASERDGWSTRARLVGRFDEREDGAAGTRSVSLRERQDVGATLKRPTGEAGPSSFPAPETLASPSVEPYAFVEVHLSAGSQGTSTSTRYLNLRLDLSSAPPLARFLTLRLLPALDGGREQGRGGEASIDEIFGAEGQVGLKSSATMVAR